MNFMNKRGLSAVVATVLLLLVTIVAVSIITPFIFKFIRGNLDEGGSCFNVFEGLGIAETGYNCYIDDSSSGKKRTAFSVRINGDEIKAFKVSLGNAGSSNAFEIKEGAQLSNIRMLDESGSANFNGPLSIPERGGIRTYVANDLFDQIEIFPVLGSGKLCEMADSVKLKSCSDAVVISDILNEP